jgi:DNA-binding SARP family transcriptional activator
MVQNYVWRLHGVLPEAGGAEIVTRGRAYELRIDAELVDVHRLERLLLVAARAAETGAISNAAREALALFHGDPAGGRRRCAVRDGGDPSARGAAADGLRAGHRCRSRRGRHQEIVVEVDGLLSDNPLRERLHAQRMLGLYRSGRQAEALEAYRQARATLVEEIGVEPRPELRRLHDAILRQDPALDLEPAATQLPAELDASASPPLVGRDGELRSVRARWQLAAAGGGSLVTIVGASGMGKTRVAADRG